MSEALFFHEIHHELVVVEDVVSSGTHVARSGLNPGDSTARSLIQKEGEENSHVGFNNLQTYDEQLAIECFYPEEKISSYFKYMLSLPSEKSCIGVC